MPDIDATEPLTERRRAGQRHGQYAGADAGCGRRRRRRTASCAAGLSGRRGASRIEAPQLTHDDVSARLSRRCRRLERRKAPNAD